MNDKMGQWLEESDEWLADVLRGGDPQDIDVAMQILQKRYQSKFERYVSKKLPPDWVQDVIQEIWSVFYGEVKVEGIKKGVSHLLWSLARRRRASAVRRLTAERNIEGDIPTRLDDDDEIESLDEPVEELLETQLQRQFLQRIPFTGSLLSDCERVLWVLREQLDYPDSVVARLTDKKSQTVYSALSYARKKVKKYVDSKEFNIRVALQEMEEPKTRSPDLLRPLIVERFANCISPQLTPDELKPLGLPIQEFRDNYVASIMLPREPYQGVEMEYPSLLLTRRSEWDDMQDMFEQLYADRDNTDHLSPEECLLKVDVDADNIVLTIEQMLEFLPEPEEWSGTDKTDNMYLSIHSPKMRIPVTFGFFDRALFTPELYERWPFLTDDVGL